jgi:hypothetical protein
VIISVATELSPVSPCVLTKARLPAVENNEEAGRGALQLHSGYSWFGFEAEGGCSDRAR